MTSRRSDNKGLSARQLLEEAYVRARAEDTARRVAVAAAPTVLAMRLAVSPTFDAAVEAARQKLAPAVEAARTKVAPSVDAARERVAPSVDAARERLTPAVETALQRWSDEVLPSLAAAVAAAAGSVGEQASTLSARADHVAKAPARRRRRRRGVVVLGAAALAAGAAVAVVKRPKSGASWQTTEPYVVPTPTETTDATATSAGWVPDAVTESDIDAADTTGDVAAATPDEVIVDSTTTTGFATDPDSPVTEVFTEDTSGDEGGKHSR